MKSRLLIAVSLSVLTSIIATGCNTTEGVGEGVVRTGEGVVEGVSKAGEGAVKIGEGTVEGTGKVIEGVGEDLAGEKPDKK